MDHIRYLSPVSLELDQIYLDPNNPRFIQEVEEEIKTEDYFSDFAQERSEQLLVQKYGLQNLQDSIYENGYLPIDRIIVKQIDTVEGRKRFLVLEGNRRIAAAKNVAKSLHDGDEGIPEHTRQSLLTIPALEYTGDDEKAAWIFQGLRHISGIKDWSAIHKARLLVEQMNEKDLTFTQVGRIFGISRYAAAQWARSYFAFTQADESDDFRTEVDYRCFPFLQEVFGRSNVSLKDWLGWNEEENRFDNTDNFEEYLGWLYPKIDDHGNVDPEIVGDWDKRRISAAIDQRLVSTAISNHENLFQSFRQGDSLNKIRVKIAQDQEAANENVDYYIDLLNGYDDDFKRVPVLKLKEEGRDEELKERIANFITTLTNLSNLL